MRRGLRRSTKSIAVSDGLIVRKYSPMRRGLRHLFQQVLEVAQGSVLERVPDAKGIETWSAPSPSLAMKTLERVPQCEGD